MTIGKKMATVFGGTGFIGRQIVRGLARQGYTVKIATRVPERAYFLRPAGRVGQVVPFACDYGSAESIAAALRGSQVAVNCIGVLYERGKRGTFDRAHVEIPARIAAACQREGVESLIHLSALGVQSGNARYAQSKRAGEQAVLSNFPAATILRPGVVFGEGDDFFNKFAEMARYLPFLPLIGGGETKFQPVYVGDVADAVMAALRLPGARGRIIELGGPEIVSFREIYERLFAHTGRRRCLVKIPFGVARMQAFFLSLLPVPPLTPDQVEMLRTDSIASPDTPGLKDLGIEAKNMDLILPRYLGVYRPGGRFAGIKA